MWKVLQSYTKPGISRRLILYTVLFSSILTLALSSTQLYWGYKHEVNLVQEQLNFIPQIHLKSLTSTLWESDADELKAQLEGILQTPNMEYVELHDKNKVLYAMGLIPPEKQLSQNFPLIYVHKNRAVEIGSIRVIASLQSAYQRLSDQVWVILIGNSIKTFLVVGFMLFFFHTLISRHLIDVANFTRGLGANVLGEKFRLNRKSTLDEQADELDLVVNALNQMQTNIKRSFTDLEKSEERFKVITKISPVGIFRTNTLGECSYVNARWCELVNSDEDKLLGESWERAIYHEDRARVSQQWRRAVAHNTAFNTECRVQMKGDKFTWLFIMVEAEINVDSHVVGFVAAVTDITERKRTEGVFRSLASGAEGIQFDAFLLNTIHCLIELYQCQCAIIGKLLTGGKNIQTLAIWANGNLVDNIEYALEGTPCQDLLQCKKIIISEDAALLYPHDQFLIDMDVESYFGFPLVASDGRIIGVLAILDTKTVVVEEWMAPVFDVISTRISLELEREFATQELQRHRENLEDLVKERTVDLVSTRDEAHRANRAKSLFLSRMSHELRTPMNAILGFGQLLEIDSDTLSDNQNDNVSEIMSAGQHLLQLINELLDLTRIESGKLEVSMEQVMITDLLQPCLTLVQTQADARRLQIIEHISQKDYSVRADYSRLKQVLVNLLSNAVKYNREQGSITLDVEIIDPQRLRINITDTGVGLSEKDMSKLFNTFERLDRINNVEGAGIGLVISKHLVELMGGQIGISSTLGEGSTFWVELSRSEAA